MRRSGRCDACSVRESGQCAQCRLSQIARQEGLVTQQKHAYHTTVPSYHVHISQEFIHAAFDGDYHLLKQYLKQGVDVDSIDDDGESAVSRAAYWGHKQCLQLLIQHGANVNLPSKKLNCTALMRACKGGHIDCVRLLLAAGADPFYKNKAGQTAVDMAGIFHCVEGDTHQELSIRAVMLAYIKEKGLKDPDKMTEAEKKDSITVAAEERLAHAMKPVQIMYNERHYRIKFPLHLLTSKCLDTLHHLICARLHIPIHTPLTIMYTDERDFLQSITDDATLIRAFRMKQKENKILSLLVETDDDIKEDEDDDDIVIVPKTIPYQWNSICCECRQSIIGTKYTCQQCHVDLCQACEQRSSHDTSHTLIITRAPSNSQVDTNTSTSISTSTSAASISSTSASTATSTCTSTSTSPSPSSPPSSSPST